MPLWIWPHITAQLEFIFNFHYRINFEKFYGPQNFHPNTTYENIRDSAPASSSTPFIENQSLYWVSWQKFEHQVAPVVILCKSAFTDIWFSLDLKHPSIYEVSTSQGASKTYTRLNNLNTSPYYRWDNSVLPRTEAFPPQFRMIAYSDQVGADEGGETGGNLFTECCNIDAQGGESCTETTGGVNFPKKDCSFLGLAFGKCLGFQRSYYHTN